MSRTRERRPDARPTSAPRDARRPRDPFAAAATDRLRSGWVAAGVALLLAGTLARTPQNGDGAELLLTALQGGVLHPPGFPLQAWLDRALAALWPSHATLAISALSLAAHAATAGFVAATLRRLGVGAPARVVAALALACYPPLWALGVQPETFALGHAFTAAAIYLAVRAATSPCAAGMRESAVVGLTLSFALSSHPLVITAAPAFLALALWVLRAPAGRAKRALVLAATAIVPGAALYASLPLLRGAAPWPDWGALRTAGDVARHALRADYGGFALSAATGADSVWAVSVWLADVSAYWKFLPVVCVFALVALAWPGRVRAAALPVLGTLVAGLALLWRGRLPAQSYSAEVLGQLQGPVMVALAILLGLGWHWAGSHVRHALATRFLAALAVLLAIGFPVAGWQQADASRDRTLELYTRAIGAELSADALYVTGGDVEALYGVPAPKGRRFPLAQQQFGLERYVTQVAPRLEPRVAGARTWSDVMAAAAAQGLTVAGSSPELLALPGAVPELRGLLFVATPGSAADLSREAVAAAVRLAPIAAELPVLPARGHAFSRFHQRRFARAFAGAAEQLRRDGREALFRQAERAAAEIAEPSPGADRALLLRAFADSARAAGY